jgi:hypothetical protein
LRRPKKEVPRLQNVYVASPYGPSMALVAHYMLVCQYRYPEDEEPNLVKIIITTKSTETTLENQVHRLCASILLEAHILHQ